MGFKSKYPSDLLSIGSDAKTVKGEKKGYKTGVLYLAPYDLAGRGNLCKCSDKYCREKCLFRSGRSEFTPMIPEARIRKTQLFFDERDWFMKKLEREIRNETKKAEAEGFTFVVRLNGTSDIPWENLNIIQKFPNTQFYDYTKDPRRMARFVKGEMPKNYHLTFSRSGGNEARVNDVLEMGGNVAVVFGTKKGYKFPATYNGYKVVDGDLSDLRFLDEKNVVVGLRLKGRENRKAFEKNGDPFVIEVGPVQEPIVA